MRIKKVLTKDEKVKKETSRLGKIFKAMDANKLATAQTLINIAAFLAITLDELQEIINRDGYTHEYKNGANQFGIKQSAEAELHIAMTRNYTAVITKLLELCPPQVKEDSKLAAMRKKRA